MHSRDTTLHILRQWQLTTEVDRICHATHVIFPCVGAGLSTATRSFFPTKLAAEFQ
jgi:hypothetical protein